MTRNFTPFDAESPDPTAPERPGFSPRSLLAPAAGLAAAAALVFDDPEAAEANRRHRRNVQHDRADQRDDRQDHRHDLRAERQDARDAGNDSDAADEGRHAVRHDVHHDSWGGATEGSTPVFRTPSQHMRHDFDAWS